MHGISWEQRTCHTPIKLPLIRKIEFQSHFWLEVLTYIVAWNKKTRLTMNFIGWCAAHIRAIHNTQVSWIVGREFGNRPLIHNNDIYVVCWRRASQIEKLRFRFHSRLRATRHGMTITVAVCEPLSDFLWMPPPSHCCRRLCYNDRHYGNLVGFHLMWKFLGRWKNADRKQNSTW